MLKDQLLQRRQCVDPAVARLRVGARLEDVIGGLLDECPQLRRIHVPEFAYDQSGKAGDVRCRHRGAGREEVKIAGSCLPAGTKHEVKHKAGSGYGADVAYGTGGSEDRIDTRCCNVDHRLSEVAVRRQSVENSRRIEPERAKPDRSIHLPGGGYSTEGSRKREQSPPRSTMLHRKRKNATRQIT